MNEMKVFENPEFGKVRTIEIDGEPWFVGKDIAVVLGYSNTKDALSRHIDDEDRRWSRIATPSGEQEMTIINESGLYSLIISSKLPNAKKFKKWVTSDVLPSIRKYGLYAKYELLENPDLLIELATKYKEEKEKRKALEVENELQRQVIEDYEPKVDYYQTILHSEDTLTVTQIAADYSISANRLNRILNEEKIQHNVNGQWVLYRNNMGKGYTKSETIRYQRSDGTYGTKLLTKWTQRGRLKIHEILTNRGIKAVMDMDGDEYEN